ncbi:MAG: hypothetical protein QOG76_6156, partial [Pseudonocardiales bacterium]|nr:hypothetical protein [Pseudonocardiales bacterium]
GFGAAPHGPLVAPHALCAVTAPAPGLTGFGAPVFGGAAPALAAGCAGFGAPVFAGAAPALATG